MLDFNVSFSATVEPDKLWDLIIIGGGPAGLTAGLYAARYKLEVLLLEKAVVSGGQLTSTQWVENYPGFPEPVLGAKLAADMEAQARLFGLKIVSETVNSVSLAGPEKEVVTDYATYKAKTVLIATGSSPRKLGLPNEAEYSGRGVSYCATCDGPFYPDKTVAVIGGGNSAFEESLFIAKYAARIYIIHRRDSFSADPILQERVAAEPRIELITDTQVTALNFDTDTRRSITLRNTRTGEAGNLEVDGVFVFVGNVPNTTLFEGQLELEQGYIVTDRSYRTSLNGVWAIGDVQAGALRQVATAVGDGAGAAYNINKYLLDQSLEA